MSPASSVPVSAATCLAMLESLPVDRLEIRLAPDHAELLAVAVVGERLDDVGAGVDEVAMELDDDLRVVEHDLGDEGSGLQVAPPLELEDIALGADRPRRRRAARRAPSAQIPRPSQYAFPRLRRLDALVPGRPLVVRELDLHADTGPAKSTLRRSRQHRRDVDVALAERREVGDALAAALVLQVDVAEAAAARTAMSSSGSAPV